MKEDTVTEIEPKIFGLGSNDSARKKLDDAGIEQMETGIVVGVTGVLMNEGRWRDIEVISLIGEIRNDISVIRIAAALVKTFNRLFPHLKVDSKPLLDEAKKIESHFENLQTQAKPVMGEVPMNIYR